jgi:predicted ATPase
MRFTRLKLENWRNFLNVNTPLEGRVFLVGPNASGKSNLLDAFRFLRDIADPQGGFQWAADTKRGGVSQIRSLHARRYSNIAIEESGIPRELQTPRRSRQLMIRSTISFARLSPGFWN